MEGLIHEHSLNPNSRGVPAPTNRLNRARASIRPRSNRSLFVPKQSTYKQKVNPVPSISNSVIPGTRPQWTERAFRRYEAVIRQIIERHPLPSAINPYPRTAETFSHRLRDALSAFVVSDWTSDISRDDCYNIFNHLGRRGPFIVSYGPDENGITQVYVGPRAEHRIPASGVRPANITIKPQEGEIDAKEEEVFLAFALLKNRELVSGSVNFVNVSENQRRYVGVYYPNVELLDEGSTTRMI